MQEGVSNQAVYGVSTSAKILGYGFGILIMIPGLLILLNGLYVSIQQNEFNVFYSIVLPIALFLLIPGLYFVLIPIRYKIIINSKGLTSRSMLGSKIFFFNEIHQVSQYKQKTKGLNSSIMWVELGLRSGVKTKLKLNYFKIDEAMQIIKFLHQKTSSQGVRG